MLQPLAGTESPGKKIPTKPVDISPTSDWGGHEVQGTLKMQSVWLYRAVYDVYLESESISNHFCEFEKADNGKH